MQPKWQSIDKMTWQDLVIRKDETLKKNYNPFFFFFFLRFSFFSYPFGGRICQLKKMALQQLGNFKF
jgi:hypothetical protein